MKTLSALAGIAVLLCVTSIGACGPEARNSSRALCKALWAPIASIVSEVGAASPTVRIKEHKATIYDAKGRAVRTIDL